jgi:peroxiredoxin
VWDPLAAQRGVSVERQTFIIDTSTMTFAHVFPSVPAVGHAEAVRDVLAVRTPL